MTRYIIGGALIIVFVVITVLSFDQQKIEYTDITKAQETGKTVQVIGKWIKDKSYDYNSELNEFVFWMEDDSEKTTKVIFTGAKPNNFELADKLVVKGKYVGDDFHASNILTKCPSKYEGTVEELKNS